MTAGVFRHPRASENEMATSPAGTQFPGDEFARRHIGPTDADLRHMLGVLGVDSLEDLLDETVPAAIRADQPLALPAARSEPDVLAALGRFADANRPRDEPDRDGLLPRVHPGCHPAQRAREPGLVHRLHPVPAGDQPGPPGSAAQLPDRRHRAHWPRGGERVVARRGDRRGRGDDDGSPVVEDVVEPLRRAPRHPPADDRRAGDEGRAGGDRTRRGRGRRPRRRVLRRPVQPADVDRRDHRLAPTRSPRFTTSAGWSS